MLVYKCDGQSYSTGRKCQNEVKHDLPDWWLIINGKIINGLFDAHYLEANGSYHFCSRNCLIDFLFKDKENSTEILNAADATVGTTHMHDPNIKTEEQTPEAQPAETVPDAEEGKEG